MRTCRLRQQMRCQEEKKHLPVGTVPSNQNLYLHHRSMGPWMMGGSTATSFLIGSLGSQFKRTARHGMGGCLLNSNPASQDTHANLLFAALTRQEARSVSQCDNQASGAKNEEQETGTRGGKLETNSGPPKSEEAGR